MWTPADVEAIKWTVIGVLALCVAAAVLGGWIHFRVVDHGDTFADTYDYDDDYFSDIHDAIIEDGGQMPGQQPLWETGDMPAVEDDERPTPKLDALVTSPPKWVWVHDAVATPEAVPQLEPGETVTFAFEDASVDPEPIRDASEDDIDSTFVRNFKAELDAWIAEQEAARLAWRKEVGLDAE